MIDFLKKTFHTETFLGKLLFLVFFYSLFWFVAYGVWVFEIIPEPGSEVRPAQFLEWVFVFYLFAILPFLSFKYIHRCNKVLGINKTHLNIINIFFIAGSLVHFVYHVLNSFKPNFF